MMPRHAAGEFVLADGTRDAVLASRSAFVDSARAPRYRCRLGAGDLDHLRGRCRPASRNHQRIWARDVRRISTTGSSPLTACMPRARSWLDQLAVPPGDDGTGMRVRAVIADAGADPGQPTTHQCAGCSCAWSTVIGSGEAGHPDRSRRVRKRERARIHFCSGSAVTELPTRLTAIE